jgi:hypothetical protein
MENVWITYHFFNEITSRPSKHGTNATWREDVDVKTDLITELLPGKQGWKCPVALLATCCGSKSLKVILIDSDFRAYPVLNPLSHCNLLQISKWRLSRTSSSADFFFGSFGILRSPVESATSFASQTTSTSSRVEGTPQWPLHRRHPSSGRDSTNNKVRKTSLGTSLGSISASK